VRENPKQDWLTGEPMKFLMLADWIGRVETELSTET